ncbi:MAG: SDR family oxidoreductase [Thermoleophilaceae bacterium]|nr:SDR family oxidoreductase [Thermoleophilaceae bacterium]
MSSIFKDDLLAGQLIVVSGGGSGIGRQAAIELTGLGADVVICGRAIEPLRETSDLCMSHGGAGSCSAMVCDIRDAEQVDALIDATLETHGKIDTLVNNAGGQFLAPAEQITEKGFDTVIKLNVHGTWLMSQAVALKWMIENGGGKIINVTLSPHNGMPGMVHSGAARAAVENMTKTLSIEWARFGVKLNALAIGQIGTETLLTKYPQVVVDNLSHSIPAGRLGKPEEVAWQIAYLASEAGDFYSGSVLTMDGSRDNWLGPWPPTQLIDDAGEPVSEDRKQGDPDG